VQCPGEALQLHQFRAFANSAQTAETLLMWQGVIGPGGVQWMTAGRGIIHSEMPKVTTGDLWGFQLWINLPAKDKMMKPRYPNFSPEHLPSTQIWDMGCVMLFYSYSGDSLYPGHICEHDYQSLLT